MNVFVLDSDPRLAAQMLCDKHVVKMCLETAQLLSSPISHADAIDGKKYKRAYFNHPWAVWTRQTFGNFFWLVEYGEHLFGEYTFRYGKAHKSKRILDWCRDAVLDGLVKTDIVSTSFAVTEMPLCTKGIVEPSGDIVQDYRDYYLLDKASFAQWNRGRGAPDWWVS